MGLVVRSAGRLVARFAWPIDRWLLVGRKFGWLVDRPVDGLSVWFIASICWIVGRSAGP